MSSQPSFPGQTERSPFTLEQVKTLSSAIRSDVFWAFNKNEPHSAAEVARALGKSAQTVHYHVHELVEVGLLIAAGTRKRRARTEALFVHASRNFVGQGPSAPAEYRKHIRKAFAAIARAMVREEDALQAVLDEKDESINAFNAYRRTTLRLSPERAAALRLRLYEALAEAQHEGDDPDGVRVNVAVYMKPTQAESRRWLARLKVAKRRAKGKAGLGS